MPGLHDYIFFRKIHIPSASIPHTTTVNTACICMLRYHGADYSAYSPGWAR